MRSIQNPEYTSSIRRTHIWNTLHIQIIFNPEIRRALAIYSRNKYYSEVLLTASILQGVQLPSARVICWHPTRGTIYPWMNAFTKAPSICENRKVFPRENTQDTASTLSTYFEIVYCGWGHTRSISGSIHRTILCLWNTAVLAVFRGCVLWVLPNAGSISSGSYCECWYCEYCEYTE